MNIQKAQELARQWMPGRRQGSGNRYAWEHPQDVANLVRELRPGDDDSVIVAWLHDLLEDGRKKDHGLVRPSDLIEAGFSQEIVSDVQDLTHNPPESKRTYLARLDRASQRAQFVKCVDRICNLREGAAVFKPRRWVRYVGETFYFIFPLTENVYQDTRERLQIELAKAAQARPVGPIGDNRPPHG